METAPCFLKGTRREDQNVIINIKLRYLHSKPQYYNQKLEERDYCLLYAIYYFTRIILLK